MEAEPPDGLRPGRQRSRRALWCTVVGLILGLVAVICLAAGAVSGPQAVGLGLPAALLIIGGLIAAAIPDPAAGQRLAFRAGSRAGSLASFWRFHFRWRRNGN